jgi:nitroreductase
MAKILRHSIRSFSDKQVDIETLKSIIADAQGAPSWENSQPYKVYLATGETAKKIRSARDKNIASGQKSWSEVVPPQEWTAAADANILDWQYQSSNSEASAEFTPVNEKLFDAPSIAYITIKKDASNYVAYDAGAFGYAILLAAEEHGVGTVPAYAFARFPGEVHEQFNIPEDEAVFMGIGLGYPDDDIINKFEPGRNDIDKILTIKD